MRLQRGLGRWVWLCLLAGFLMACSGLGEVLKEMPEASPGTLEQGLKVNVEAVGTLTCDGDPLAFVPVELWDDDGGADEKLEAGHTDADGRFFLRASGGDIGSNPDLYVRAVYLDQIPGKAADGSDISSKLRIMKDGDEFIGSHARYDSSDRINDAIGAVDFGSIDLGPKSGDCEVFRHARAMLVDWHTVMQIPFPAEARILRMSKSVNPKQTPYTEYDLIKLPSFYVTDLFNRRRVLPETLFHEMAHIFWFTLHGNVSHWHADLAGFQYARDHKPEYHARDQGGTSCGLDTCVVCLTSYCAEGFAFSEGWAEFWALRAGLPNKRPDLTRYTPWVDTLRTTEEWEYEGNVMQRLRAIAGCLGGNPGGYRKMVQIALKYNLPFYTIHSLEDYERLAEGEYPELSACLNDRAPLCNKFCQSDGDCDTTCPYCNPVQEGELTVARCQAVPYRCGKNCRYDSECGGDCPYCVGEVFGDVTRNPKCTSRQMCGGTCRTDSNCAIDCPYCNAFEQDGQTAYRCETQQNFCKKGCSKDTECGGTCPFCHTEPKGDLTYSYCSEQR